MLPKGVDKSVPFTRRNHQTYNDLRIQGKRNARRCDRTTICLPLFPGDKEAIPTYISGIVTVQHRYNAINFIYK